MALIDQTVPEKEKTKDWIHRVARKLFQDADSLDWQSQKDLVCRNLVKGRFNEADFDYLTKVGQYTFPAKIRFIPIIKNNIHNLVSDYSLRPFKFATYAFNSISVDKKIESESRFFLDNIHKRLWDFAGNYRVASQQIQEILAMSEQAQQQLSQSDQAAMMEEMGQNSGGPQPQFVLPPEMKNELERINQMLNKKFMLSQQEISEIDKLYKMKPRELYEILAQKGLEYCIYTQQLERQFLKGFQSKLVTNKAIYFVDYDETMKDPQLRSVNETGFAFDSDGDTDLVQKTSWGYEKTYPSVAVILDQYRYDLTDDDIQKLFRRNLNGYGRQYYGNSLYNGSCYVNVNGISVPIIDTGSTCSLVKVYFKSPRKVLIEKKQLEKGTHTRYYEDNEVDGDTIKKRKEKGYSYNYRWVHDTYECILIDDDICIKARKKPYQFRDMDTYEVDLPFIGDNWFNERVITDSAVWDAKDIQFMYNIVAYFKELTLALSGTKGSFMDKSQIPAGMSMAEWEYKKKMGTAYVETMKNGRPATYNQFQHYDDSLSQSIQYYMQMLDYLERLCGKVMGVPPERVGMIENGTLVGNNDRAIRQSNLTTELRFKEHDMVRKMAMERMVNMFKVSWRNGKRGAYMFNGLEDILNIPAMALSDSQMKLFVEDGSKNKMAKDLAASILGSKTAAGQIPLSSTIHLLNVDSLTQLEHDLKKYEQQQQEIENERIRLQEESRANADIAVMEKEAQLKEKEAELQAQVEASIKQFDLQMKEMELKLLESELAMEEMRMQFESELEHKKIDSDNANNVAKNQIENSKIASEREIEFAYLAEEARQHNNEIMLRIKELKSDIELMKEKAKVDTNIKYQKAAVDIDIKRKKAAESNSGGGIQKKEKIK